MEDANLFRQSGAGDSECAVLMKCSQETGLLTPNGEELGGMPTAMCLVFVPVEAGGNNAAL